MHELLPGGYAASTKKYPVVYLMDSQWDFPDLKSIYGQQYFDGFIPELIVVGVTWAEKILTPTVYGPGIIHPPMKQDCRKVVVQTDF